MDVVSTPRTAYDGDSSTTTTAVLGQLNLDLPNPAGVARSEWEVRYVTLLVLADLLIGMAAAAAALVLRFGPAANETYNRNYVWLTVVLPIAWLLTLAVNRAFEVRYLFLGTDEYERLFRAGLALTAALAVLSFTFDLRLARGYVVIAVPLATVAGVCFRYIVRHRLHRKWAQGQQLRRVILVGHEQSVYQTSLRLARERYHGLGVVGACLPTIPNLGRVVLPGLPPIYGSFDEVPYAVQLAEADTVIVLSCPELDGSALRRLAWKLERDDIDLMVAGALVDVRDDRTTIRPAEGLPLLHIEHARLKGASRVLKEVFDVVVALLGVVALLPVLLVVALLIKTTPGARGPVIFRQTRTGRDGRQFVMYKFRTMYRDAEVRLAQLRARNDCDGTLFKMRRDPRVTPLGRWLRRLSLDEVPQLINVLKGDMSLVGPRPPLPGEVAEYPFDMRRRLVVKPGLTGLWQVSGRSDLSWEESVRLDLRYVDNWSFTMDLAILARTMFIVFRHAGAY